MKLIHKVIYWKMKTYKEQKNDNKSKIHWLKKVTNDDMSSVFALVRSRQEKLIEGYVDMYATSFEITHENEFNMIGGHDVLTGQYTRATIEGYLDQIIYEN